MAGKKKDNGGRECGEFCPSGKIRTAIIDGVNFKNKSVQYTEVDGMAMFEGDIILGTVAEVDRKTEQRRKEMQGDAQEDITARGLVITGAQYRWPKCIVPYTIDAALPNQARVTDAIAHWETNTRFRFVLRTAANAATYPDYVNFRPSTGCSSYVGRQGGQQPINLASGCTTGNTIHEIGHSVGLWHEHSREDRDAFVTIHWDKIQAGTEHNFYQHITDGDDIGAYDYGSIMHYPRTAFSTDGSDTITPTDPAASIGQRVALSAGDIAAANSMCPITIICPPSPLIKCPPAPLVKCPPAPLVKCPPAPKITCAAAPQIKCPPAPKIACPPAPKITSCPPAPKITCAAGPTNVIIPGPQEVIHTIRGPLSGDQPGGSGQAPQVTININYYGYQPPASQSDPVEPPDWETTEYETPDESADETMSEGSETEFNPEYTE
jgi:hypothetical protein